MRYTFVARRTWPCADALQIIAENSPNATVTWSPVPGTYRIEVVVRQIAPTMSRLQYTAGQATLDNFRDDVSGCNPGARIGFVARQPTTSPTHKTQCA